MNVCLFSFLKDGSFYIQVKRSTLFQQMYDYLLSTRLINLLQFIGFSGRKMSLNAVMASGHLILKSFQHYHSTFMFRFFTSVHSISSFFRSIDDACAFECE